jgi:hypothetical protein
MVIRTLACAVLWIGLARLSWAGPPFITDDPEPVEYRHWEIYVASQLEQDKAGWSGTSPHFEVNYGALPNLQLHLIAPVSFSAAAHGATNFGYGDTELGAKYRFFEETDQLPQMGVFPLVEIPSGSRARDLGSGHAQVFLPLWLQKNFGSWTTYGGGGYWINPGKNNHDWLFTGWVLQHEITAALTLGGEIFHETPNEKGGGSDTRLNFGGFYNFSDTYHLLFSAGHTIQGPSTFQGYLAFQITVGPQGQSERARN